MMLKNTPKIFLFPQLLGQPKLILRQEKISTVCISEKMLSSSDKEEVSLIFNTPKTTENVPYSKK